MKWNTEYFGFRLLVFVGFCGEVPVALLRKAGVKTVHIACIAKTPNYFLH